MLGSNEIEDEGVEALSDALVDLPLLVTLTLENSTPLPPRTHIRTTCRHVPSRDLRLPVACHHGRAVSSASTRLSPPPLPPP